MTLSSTLRRPRALLPGRAERAVGCHSPSQARSSPSTGGNTLVGSRAWPCLTDAPERTLALPILLRLRLQIPPDPTTRTSGDQELRMDTEDIVEKWRTSRWASRLVQPPRRGDGHRQVGGRKHHPAGVRTRSTRLRSRPSMAAPARTSKPMTTATCSPSRVRSRSTTRSAGARAAAP